MYFLISIDSVLRVERSSSGRKNCGRKCKGINCLENLSLLFSYVDLYFIVFATLQSWN